ncbi:MAG: peptidoglycan DD-metalloendopeptidase family protein [Patescibacteria group bacterium]
MGKSKTKILILAVLLTVFLTPKALASEPSLNLLSEEDQQTIDTLKDNLKSKLKRGTFYVLGIETKIKNSTEELKILNKNMQALEEKIEDSKTKIDDLKSQLQNFDRLIVRNQEKIQAVELQVAEGKNQILVLEDDMHQAEGELDSQVKSLDKVISAYYFQNNLFFDAEDSPRLLAFLAADGSTGEVLRENEYLLFLQNASNDLAKQIIETQNELNRKRTALEDKKEKTIELQNLLVREKRIFMDAQESRKRLIDETKGRQAIYEALLDISRKEVEQVNQEVMRLKENYSFFQARLDELKKLPGASGISLDFQLEEGEIILKDINNELAWPVSPALGLSALYHDSAYEKAMGIRHEAVDIRLVQGSKVRAPADGIVSKVADNGFGYSYIIIAHPNKILTLYGHISEMLVTEGEIVRQGQVMGLSGGIPGTKGAGWLTTGAHLHFEVFKDFQHVDPLDYLPLEFVPITSLPEKYLKRLTGEEETKKIRRLEL